MKLKLISVFSLISILTNSPTAIAKNISDLALQCSGTYEVVEATPYFIPGPTYPTRSLKEDSAGAKEKIKILSLTGSGCEKLGPYYGINIQVGNILPYSKGTWPPTAAQAKTFATTEFGKTYSFEVSQTYTYALPNGDLPLFPLVHQEYVQILNLNGVADSKALYETPSVADLDDTSKSKIIETLMSIEDWGIIYQGYGPTNDEWLQLLTSLDFSDANLELEHIQNLVLFFNNMVKKTTMIHIGEPVIIAANKISLLLNKYGKSKWSTKLQILKMNPALLNEQGVTWSEPDQVLHLTSSEIEEFLEYSLIQVQNLSLVPQVGEAQVLKSQYKGAAEGLKASPIAKQNFFDLSPKSQELIAKIISL